MPEATDWNTKIIEEFRANEGRVGGNFEGAPMVLVHHRGRKSGREYVNPMMYLPDEARDNVIYVFASKAGAPSQPRLVLQPARPWARARSSVELTAIASRCANSPGTSAIASTPSKLAATPALPTTPNAPKAPRHSRPRLTRS